MTYPYEGAKNDHTFSGPKLQSSADVMLDLTE